MKSTFRFEMGLLVDKQNIWSCTSNDGKTPRRIFDERETSRIIGVIKDIFVW